MIDTPITNEEEENIANETVKMIHESLAAVGASDTFNIASDVKIYEYADTTD